MASTKTTASDAVPSEHFEQREVVKWFRQTHRGVRIFAIPNGGQRSIAAATRLKIEGVSAGVPDLFIPAWRLWVEMKRVKGGVLSAEQKDWIKYLEEVGYCAKVCKGAEDAKEQITAFFNQNKDTL
jgi:rhodanese-related sulfurtransferase